MGTSLSGLLPQDTYQGLLKFGDNSAISASLKVVSDGAGNNSLLYLSTSAIAFGSSSNFYWDNTNSRLGIGTSSPISTLTLNEATGNPSITLQRNGASKGSFYETSGGTQLQGGGNGLWLGANGRQDMVFTWDGNNYSTSTSFTFGSSSSLGAKLGIKGSGSTSATTSLLVQDSTGQETFRVRDNNQIDFRGGQLSWINPAANCWRAVNGGSSPNVVGTHWLQSGNFIINDGTSLSSYNTSVMLGVVSTTKGFLPPVMTTTQKNAISSPASGLVVYDTTMNATCEYTGTAWRVVSAGSQALAAPTASTSVDLSAGNVVNLSLTSSTTLTFTGAAIGTYIMRIIQGGSGSYTITWPASVIWSGGTAPTLTTTVAKSDIVTLIYDGTNYYGNYSLNY